MEINTTPRAVEIGSPSYRPNEVDEELDYLKQRGLAKLLNKHFTEETRRIAQEREAADRALRDLELRKADTASFHPSLNSEGGWENLIRSVTEWRNDCRAKEKETLALYQRYVHKFGYTGQVKAPEMPTPSAPKATTTTTATPMETHNKHHKIEPLDCELSPSSSSGAPTPLGVPPPSVDLPHTPITPGTELKGSIVKETASSVGQFLMDRNLVRNLASEGNNIDTIRSYYMDQVVEETETKKGEPTTEAGDEPSIHLHEEGSDVSCLTDNSYLPPDILEDCERTVVTFLNQEREALRQYKEELATQASDLESSVQNQAVTEAEHLVQAMQRVLKDYQIQGSPKGKPLKTSNPNETWMVHYDDTFKREYYHELNSDRTQWEPPEMVDSTCGTTFSELNIQESSSPMAESPPLLSPVILSHDEVMPEVSETRVSRIAAYRKKRRRRRRRRIVAGTILAAASAYGAKKYFNYQAHVKETQVAEEVARSQATLKLEQELAEARAAALREREKAAAEWAALEAARMEAAEEAKKEASLRRPWGCNLPLAYLVNDRCFRLSNENPVFDLDALVNDMVYF